MHKLTARLKDLCFLLPGCFLFALSVSCFTAPNNIAPGGATGAAILLHTLTGAPVGLLTLVINIPLFLWGLRVLGKRAIAKSLAATLLSSALIDLTAAYLPAYQGDVMLAAVFAGVLSGGGLGLILMRGATTGGTDLLASLLARRFRGISLGRLLLCIDLPIVLLSVPVFGTIESPMYALIAIFLTTKGIDTLLDGADAGQGKLLLIISRQSAAIRDTILYDIPRGVTALRAQGCYSCCDQTVLLCAVRRREVTAVLDRIHALDPDAFLVVTEAAQILGEGFRRHKRP